MERRPAPIQPPAQASGDPWSEVPEELEQLLRAELTRKGSPAAASEPETQPGRQEADQSAAAEAKPKRVTRSRAKPAAPETTPPAKEDSTEAAPARPKRGTRSKASAETADKPKRATRSRAKAADAPAAAAGDEQADATDDAPAKPVRRRRTKAAEESTEG